jgi:hypothetical protein
MKWCKQPKQSICWEMMHFEVIWGLILALPSTPKPPPWVQTSGWVYQLTHFCVFLPQGTISMLYYYHIYINCEPRMKVYVDLLGGL